jgi:acyl-CoA synthetase (AMP-forming)/AMP-acid ligase II
MSSDETQTVLSAFERVARSAPHRIYLDTDGRALSYAEVERLVSSVQAQLGALGVSRGHRVLVLSKNPVVVVSTVYACMRVDAVYVVLNAETSPTNLDFILDNCRPYVAVGDPDLVANTFASSGAIVASNIDATLSVLEHNEALTDAPVGVASILYTSGSTGTPKGVTITRDNIGFSISAIHERLRYDERDRVAVYLPLSFDYGLYQLFLAAWCGAACVVRRGTPTSALLAKCLKEDRISVFPAVPALAEALVVWLKARGADGLSGLRKITNTGQALHPQTVADLNSLLPHVEVFPMYGLTECKRVSILLPHERAQRPTSVGRALTGTEVYVVDDAGARLPAGSVGEIVVSGKNVCLGYWNDDEKTSIRFVEHDGRKHLHTGDFGYVDEQGFLYFSGRRDSIIKRRAMRISLLEIEAALRTQGNVSSCAAVYDEGKGLLVMYAECLDDSTPQTLLDYLKTRLEAYKIPDRIVIRDKLPLSANGKVDRQQLLSTA